MQIEFEGSPYSFKKIINALFKYKWINLLIILTTISLGLLYYYLKSPTYESTATVEISANTQGNRLDFFGNVIAGTHHSAETEIDILKSEFLLFKTLYAIDRSISYYKTVKLKKIELYKDMPFQLYDVNIHNSEIVGRVFNIKHINKTEYQLSMKDSLLTNLFGILPSWAKVDIFKPSKKEIYKYGEVVNLPDCSFVIKKTGLYNRASYSFVLNEQEQIVEEIKNNLSIKPASFQSSVLKITYRDNIAKRAKEFLNSYVQNYIQYSKRNIVETDAKTLDFINKQLTLVSDKLGSSEDELQQYKTAHNILDIQTQKIELVEQLSDFQKQLKNAEIELNVVKKLYLNVKRGDYNIISSIEEDYPVLNTMLVNLEEIKMERERKLALFTDNHPDVVSLLSGINNLQNAILDISKGILEKSKDKVFSLKRVVKNYTQKLQALPEIEKELIQHERLFTVNDKVYNYLLQKQSELSVEKAATVLNKKILDFAKEPIKPLSPKRNLVLTISLFLGLILSLFHSMLRVKHDTKIKNRNDIYALTDIPLFGVIPFVKNSQKYNSAYVLDEPNSSTSEAFRDIKNSLEYTITTKKSKVILVTSTVPNEGKTTVSANLAAVLGMGDKRSIILSLDLRRPELHHKFMLSNKVGMSDVLSGKMDISKVTWENESFHNFNIVTSGAIPPNPSELLASNRMGEIIEELSQSYDYIILDTPPFEYVNDALSLIKYADITFFVVKSEFTDEKNISEINKIVKKLNIENAGLILNSVKVEHLVEKKFDYKYIYHEAQ